MCEVIDWRYVNMYRNVKELQFADDVCMMVHNGLIVSFFSKYFEFDYHNMELTAFD